MWKLPLPALSRKASAATASKVPFTEPMPVRLLERSKDREFWVLTELGVRIESTKVLVLIARGKNELDSTFRRPFGTIAAGRRFRRAFKPSSRSIALRAPALRESWRMPRTRLD